jgi:Cd2+/Zn2+-exporting ATPase
MSRISAWVAARRELLTVAASGSLVATAWIWRWSAGQGAAAPFGALMTLAAIVAGIPVAREAIARLQARQFSIALLVTIAAVGALWIGEAWEAAAVTLLFVLGGWLESLTLAKTRAALRQLVDLAPRTARVMRDGALMVVGADEVSPGEVVIVLPGDRVPVDGKVTAGQAVLDTAALTGEPLPVEAGLGDKVLGGSISRGGHLEVLAERVGPDTTFSRLIFLVAEAQDQKPKVQRMLDAFARWYTPSVIVAAIVLLAITADVHLALTFLVIACPGALVVASPVAVVAGLGHAARQGILIKGGERLERIARTDTVAFDKTGTLTLGRPSVATVVPFAGTEDELVAYAAAAEQRSEHHLATAVLLHAASRGVPPAQADNWRLLPGLGATADVETAAGIAQVLVGNRRLLAAHDVGIAPAQEDLIAAREARGETVAIVAVGGTARGLLGITDPLRPEASHLVAALRKAGVRHVTMLTGDNPAAARRVGDSIGIADVRAGLLPEHKVAAIRSLQAEGRVVAMIGDGVNDAPALAVADVSIAMGASGTQAAIETADVALMQDRLQQIPYAISLSKQIMRVVRQNVAFAVGVVVVLMAGVISKQVHLAGGMLVHEASVLIVIGNGMRLMWGAGRLE